MIPFRDHNSTRVFVWWSNLCYHLSAPFLIILLITHSISLPSFVESSQQQSIPYELAREVAKHYATVRWEGARLGEGQLYYDPNGFPEVYFFVVFKKGVVKKSTATLLQKTNALRSQRIEQERLARSSLPSVSKEAQVVVKDIWIQMSAPDKYGTIVIGAHEGREPFIASYSGLPPHIFLREDAIETARHKLRGRKPNKIRYIWQPPLFVVFEISEGQEAFNNVQLEVKGTKLHQINIQQWRRSKLNYKVLQQRKQKWRSWRRSLSED